jgi:hypothetical protein
MSKIRKGWVVERAGKFYVNIGYTDDLGKRRELMRRAENKKHAKKLRKELVEQLASAEPGKQRAELKAKNSPSPKSRRPMKPQDWFRQNTQTT